MNRWERMSRWGWMSLIGLALFFGLNSSAFAGSYAKQLRTAFAHAGYSSKSKDAKMVHLHLYHTINCLEGRDGKDFNAAAGNPCKGQGNGALTDISGHPEIKTLMRQALSLATTAVGITAYQPSRRVALAVDELLQEAIRKSAK